jgi:hypothetical protein
MLIWVFTQDDSPLTNNLGVPNTDMANVKVALLPMTFQNWSRSQITCGTVLPDSVTHDRHCVYIPMATPRRAKAEAKH